MPWVEVAGTDIYYQECGEGQPFVMLHGNSSCCEAWFQQFAHFPGRFRVIAYDSVNHGHSSNSPRDDDEPDRVDELEGFLAALAIERPILAGNSMGAATILRWAARHPADARALIPSGMGVPPEGAAFAPAAARPLDEKTLFLPTGDAFTERFKADEPRMYERYLRIRSTATRLEAMRFPRRASARSTAERESLAGRITAVSSPMCIIAGGLDRLVPWCERLHGLVPGSEYHVVDGAPHNVYYETAAAYNGIVDRFLERVLPRLAANSAR